MRIVILCHAHPDLRPGGSERASYSLFQRLKGDKSVTKAFFVARALPEDIGHNADFGCFRSRHDEILVNPPPINAFTLQTLHYDRLKKLVQELIEMSNPDIVHVHHFIDWGIEIFELFKNAGIRVVFTFHEFGLICAHYGQMVKTNGDLCFAASAVECSKCLPKMSAQKFFVRSLIIQKCLESVDSFIAPSKFLKARFVEWGISEERISVIDNLLDQSLIDQSISLIDNSSRSNRFVVSVRKKIVFAFFGQINPFKGLDILLQACILVDKKARKSIELRIHGENKNYRGGALERKIKRLISKSGDVVKVKGRYRNEEVLTLMASCDWIVIPSIWWENSPLVIKEARLAGKPIICSNIGGMAEKVDANIDLLFSAGNAVELATCIEAVVADQGVAKRQYLIKLAKAHRLSNDLHYAEHLKTYDR